jgi:hypothetical protein
MLGVQMNDKIDLLRVQIICQPFLILAYLPQCSQFPFVSLSVYGTFELFWYLKRSILASLLNHHPMVIFHYDALWPLYGFHGVNRLAYALIF